MNTKELFPYSRGKPSNAATAAECGGRRCSYLMAVAAAKAASESSLKDGSGSR